MTGNITTLARSRLCPSGWLAGLAIAACVGCGASMEAVYEGDVRFEHCMALDARPDVKPQMRRACWQEWVTHYNYGQTRDRLDHARQRIAELGGGGFATGRTETAFVGDDSISRDSVEPASPERHAICAGTCEAVHDDCAETCSGGACQRSCSLGYQRCMLSCG